MVKKLVTLFAAILIVVSVFAQVPQKMSYQAIIRNSYNVLVTNKKVSMKISILQNQTPVYVELQTTTTNENGLINVEIGNGIVLTGVFANIDWGKGIYYIKTETDPDGGTYYSIVGTSELLSVPYALYSTASGNGVSIDDASVSTTKTWSSDKINTELGTKVNSTALATVATTGSFSDLKNKPTTLAGYGITDGGSGGGGGTGTGLTMSGDATQNTSGVVKISNNAITSTKIMDGAVEDQDLDKSNIPLSGFATPESNVSMGGYKLTNLSDPTSSKDAVTKSYVDNAVTSGASTFVPIMSLDNNMNLSMRGGNAVSLADLYQSLSLAGTILSISGPRDSHVDLAAIIAAGGGGGSSTVSHDATLTGTGTSSNVLGLASQAISPTKMTGIYSNGNAGQMLTSTGNGSFTWTDPASGSGGGLTAVNVTPNNGITASVTNVLPTSVLTLGLGAITPSSITTSGTITTTGNLNASDITATTLNGSLNASNLTGTLRPALFAANTIPTTALAGNGTAAAGSFLRGDGTWAVPASGGISNVSVTTNAGVSGVVTNPTTAPAIALTLGDITPTSVTTGAVTATGLKLTTGASNGYVLKTDNAGNASWQSASSSYKGMWNASTNTPLITNGVGSNGDYYVVSTSGSYGGTAFTQGGQAVFNGTSGKWESIAAVETDPMVKAINGMVKSNGTTITAAVPGTDYLLPAMTANRLLGSGLAGTSASEITLGTNLSFTGNTLNAAGGGDMRSSVYDPAGIAGQVVGLTATQTLTGKTISAGSNTITGLTNANFSGTAGITDANLATISTSGKVANSATSATTTNTANSIALRDATGAISATTFTGNLTGNVTGNITGNVAGNATSATTATTATNIAGGGVGIVYQSAANTTTEILNSSASTGNVLTWTGGPAPVWQAPAVSGGTVTNVSVTVGGGITGTVTNGGTSPLINLGLGAITPTSVNTGAITSSGLVSASGLQLTTGANNGYVLKSDAAGNATWQATTSSYKGMWNAATNTPAIANGSGTNGDYYVVSASGSFGGVSFTQGGQAVYNGSTSKWESISAVETDPMVKAITGIVKSNGTTITAAVPGTDYLIPAMTANRLLGSGLAGTAASEITLGTNLSFTGNTLNATGGGGGVTSVVASGGTTGLTYTGSPITTSGTLTLGGTLSIANGGTGGTTLLQALTNLGAQPVDPELTALAAISSNGIYARTGAGAVAARTITGTANMITVTNGDGAAGNPTITLPVTGVTAKSYTSANITVDAQGRITLASDGSGGSVTPGPQTGPLYGTPVRSVNTAGPIAWTLTDVNLILLPGYSGDIVFPSALANKGRIVGVNNRSGALRLIANVTGGDTGIYGDEGWSQITPLVGMVCVISDGTSWRLYSGRP